MGKSVLKQINDRFQAIFSNFQNSRCSSICEACRSLFRAIYQNCTCKKLQWINATEKFARSQTFDKRQFKLQNYSQEKLEDFSSGFFTFISSIAFVLKYLKYIL